MEGNDDVTTQIYMYTMINTQDRKLVHLMNVNISIYHILTDYKAKWPCSKSLTTKDVPHVYVRMQIW